MMLCILLSENLAMSFRIHKLDNQAGKLQLQKASYNILSQAEQNRLIDIEGRIIELYIEKQEGQIGITSLGNTMRSDKLLKSFFSPSSTSNFNFIKLTENRRSFLKVFIKTLHDFLDTKNIFVILDASFGKETQLVDSSFLTVGALQEELAKVSRVFRPNFRTEGVFFAELYEFSGYGVGMETGSDLNNTYTKLFKL